MIFFREEVIEPTENIRVMLSKTNFEIFDEKLLDRYLNKAEAHTYSSDKSNGKSSTCNNWQYVIHFPVGSECIRFPYASVALRCEGIDSLTEAAASLLQPSSDFQKQILELLEPEMIQVKSV